MSDEPKRKSPRYPSLSLEDALSKALQFYDANHLHPVANDAAAQSMGYAGANNGASLSTLAALKYYGLVDRVGNGKLAASKDLETYRYAPSATERKKILRKWLLNPQIFEEIYQKYDGHLPSDAAVKYDLIQMGFIPDKAEICVKTFKDSISFVDAKAGDDEAIFSQGEYYSPAETPEIKEPKHTIAVQGQTHQPPSLSTETDRIPVRLQGGRRAWLEIPIPFYSSDKEIIKKQIELLITDDDNKPS
jgi:hypothetical protein